MKKVAILQARVDSSRLPNKVLKPLSGRPVILHIIDRLKRCSTLDEICVAIPDSPSDDSLIDVLSDADVTIARGSGHDVLSRYIAAAYQTCADIIVRATADNPLVHPPSVDAQVTHILNNPGVDYVTTWGLPLGCMVETFTRKTLDRLDFLSKSDVLREHVTYFIYQNGHSFNIVDLEPPAGLKHPELRLTLDTDEDYRLISAVYDALHKDGEIVQVGDVVALLAGRPDLAQINAHIVQVPPVGAVLAKH
jgi:spore coat polysaccharide biosynthesis protein SpsF